MISPQTGTYRLLIVDDNKAIHQDLRKILAPDTIAENELAADEALLFQREIHSASRYEIDSAFQGHEALSRFQQARGTGKPYSLAFIDIRMPPGWDGVETISRLWAEDAALQVVICTAYTDYSWHDIVRHLGHSHNFVILRKPFDNIEVLQLADALTAKWSAMREAEEHMEVLKAEIEDHKKTQNELLVAKRIAEESNQAKRAFLANMSHELRTPLNAIIGYSELLEEQATELNLTECVSDLRKIADSGRYLLLLVNDLLDISKIEAGKMDLSMGWVDVQDLISEALITVEPMAKKNGNKLVLGPMGSVRQVYTDATKFKQILYNLLGNACKFTKGGTVTVDVGKVADGSQRWIEWSVRDTGSGIAPEQMDKLFKPFCQAGPQEPSPHKGTGLGLAISKGLCELMGGDIHVHSQPGRGSTFTIRLPDSGLPG